MTITDTLQILDESQKLMSDTRNTQVLKLEKRFSQADLEKAVSLAFDFLVKRTQEMKEESIRALNKEASQGKPLKERSPEMQRKILWCDEEIKRLSAIRKKYTVKPFHWWVQPGYFDYIKSVGLARFVQLNLEEIIHYN